MSKLEELKKSELIDLAKSLELDVKADDNKDEIVKIIIDSGKYSEEEELPDQKEFNMNAYERYSFLHIDKQRRKGEKLSEAEQKEMDSLKKYAFSNPGKKSMVTKIYKVGARKIYLIEGLPVPNDVYNSFSEYAKENLFM